MTGTFIDTIIICTMTGLAVVASGLWTGDLNGASLTNGAFAQAFPSFGNYLVTICLALFAFHHYPWMELLRRTLPRISLWY